MLQSGPCTLQEEENRGGLSNLVYRVAVFLHLLHLFGLNRTSIIMIISLEVIYSQKSSLNFQN